MSTVIETHGLTKRYLRAEAVRDLDLTVEQGTAFALLGRNGAGKTTTIKLLAGLLHPTRGHSSLLGIPSRELDGEVWTRIGYVSENQELYDWMKVGELIDFTSRLYLAWDGEFAEHLRKKLALGDLNKRVKHCSRGQRTKLKLLLSLAYRPELLILDEPFTGLDALVREEILSSVVEIMDERTWTVLLATHDIDEVERLVDHVGLIDLGHLELSESLQSLQSRFRRVQMVLSETPEEPVALPEVLELEQQGTSLRFIHERYSEETGAELAQHFPGASIDTQELSLKEIFIVLARRYQGAES